MIKINELKAEIVRNGLTVKEMAGQLGINPATLSNKINSHTEFTRDEIVKIGEILHLPQKKIASIFFC